MVIKFDEYMNEYFKWNDDVTEKTIDLGELYDQQEGNPDAILGILKYEFRPSQDNNKKIIIYNKKDPKLFWQLYNNSVESYVTKGILFSDSFALKFYRFKDFVIKIKIIKPLFTMEDPYGEEDWGDTNEAYYPDLSPYNYSWEMPECVNIGWLDENHSFEKGDVPDGLVEKLRGLPRFAQHCGYHNCPFCQGGRETWSSSIKLAIGDGVVYLFPELIAHYIIKHHYKPPQEFIDAVFKMENMTEGDARKYMNNLMLKHKDHFDKMLHRKR